MDGPDYPSQRVEMRQASLEGAQLGFVESIGLVQHQQVRVGDLLRAGLRVR